MRWDQRRRGGAAGPWASTGFAVLTGESVIPEERRFPSIPGAVLDDGMVAPASGALALKMSCEIQLSPRVPSFLPLSTSQVTFFSQKVFTCRVPPLERCLG